MPARHPPRRRVVAAGHGQLNRFRRLLTRWEKKAAHSLAFARLADGPIVSHKLRHARLLSG